MTKAKNADLFHKDGNATVKLPKNLVGKTVITDPHAKAPNQKTGVKKTQKGWNN